MEHLPVSYRYLALFDYKTGGIGRWYKSGISQQFDYTGPVGFDYSRQSGIEVVCWAPPEAAPAASGPAGGAEKFGVMTRLNTLI